MEKAAAMDGATKTRNEPFDTAIAAKANRDRAPLLVDHVSTGSFCKVVTDESPELVGVERLVEDRQGVQLLGIIFGMRTSEITRSNFPDPSSGSNDTATASARSRPLNTSTTWCPSALSSITRVSRSPSWSSAAKRVDSLELKFVQPRR
jgi:hypothetical protein